MKKVAKIDPEKEYQTAKQMIELASKQQLDPNNAETLDASVENLITAARVLMEREERRRGAKKSPKEHKSKGRKKGDKRASIKKLPSERYPELEVREDKIEPDTIPTCPCCGEQMKESGLFDTSEKLEVDPKQYYIIKNKRPKYNCGKCHGAIVNTAALPSIVPSSNYGDSLIIDVSLSKYCDLIPVERYVQMAARNGLEGLPAQSLIGLTHHLANYLTGVYELIKLEVLLSLVLQADETTHKMLEGDDTKNWYLWGFFSSSACFMEAHGTRSGDIAYDFLKQSQAQYLMSDGYSGYSKAIKKVSTDDGRQVIEVHCNAHAYRYFKEAAIKWKDEAAPFLKLYGDIYELEREGSKNDSHREQMVPLFEEIKEKCKEGKKDVMPKSHLEKALNYFLNHYTGLTQCTKNANIPLDNNLSERELRAPVVGRKTWYGTHSKRGAKTSAILFSIVQSCKLNNINPRNYFPWVVKRLHNGEDPLTPYKYSLLKETQ